MNWQQQITAIATSIIAATLGAFLARWLDTGTIATLAGLLGSGLALFIAHVAQWVVHSKWWQQTTPDQKGS